MCLFCAAIPATLAIGANAKVQQDKRDKKTVEASQPTNKFGIRVGLTTSMVVGGLLVSSIIYHTHQGG